MKDYTKVYFVLTLLLVIDFILYLSNAITLATKIADQILFWSWVISTFIIVFKHIKKAWAKIYGIGLLVLTFLSMLPMGVPFLSIIIFMIPDFNHKYLYSDDEIRLELTSKSVIGIPYTAVIKNYLIFEKEIDEIEYEFVVKENYYSTSEINSVYRSKSSNSNTTILTFDFGADTIMREVRIK